MIARSLAFAFLLAPLAAIAQQNPASRWPVLSAPDCAGPANIVAEDGREPANQTHMRIQHIGDPGTEELRREVDNEVTWDVGAMTGLRLFPFAQRGYRDAPPPVAASAFQLYCGNGGFFLNSAGFSHTQPLFGEGPSAGIGRTLDPPLTAFEDEQSVLALQAYIAVPTSHSPNLVAGAGVTQVGFYYYVRDTTTGTVIAQVIGVLDNRPPGFGGSGEEILSHDGITAFAGSPLAAVDGKGNPVRFVEPPAYGAMHYGQTWDEPLFFRAEMTHARFKAMLEALATSSLPGTRLSTNPLDYRVIFFGVLAEIVVGTDRNHEVMLGGSVRDLTLARGRSGRRVGRSR